MKKHEKVKTFKDRHPFFLTNPHARQIEVLDTYLNDEISILFRADAMTAPNGTGWQTKGILYANVDAPDGCYMLVVDQGEAGVVSYEFDVSMVAAIVTPVLPQVYSELKREAAERQRSLEEEADRLINERLAHLPKPSGIVQ